MICGSFLANKRTFSNPYPAPLLNPAFSRELSVGDSFHHVGASDRIVFIMVGLPARGKSYIGRKLSRYLTWMGFKSRVFNIGSYRRETHGAKQDASFFDPHNPANAAKRHESAMTCLADMFTWFEDDAGQVAIYDGTNSTKERRQMVLKQLRARSAGGSHTYKPIFIESICNNEELIEANIREVKISNPDYKGQNPDQAVADFRNRIAMYKKVYETVDDDDEAFVKIIDTGRKVIANRVRGYLEGRALFYLSNLQIVKKPIFLSRHGESEYNLEGRVGGDAPLSRHGRAYATALADFISEQKEFKEMIIFCSTLRRTIETASYIKGKRAIQWRALSEIEVGVCDGMTYREIAETMPAEFRARQADRLSYRYPRGESYKDVIARLEPVIFELERAEVPVLVVGHRAILRAVYAYFADLTQEDVPDLPIPLHTLIKLVPKAYGCVEERHEFAVPSVDDNQVRADLIKDPGV